MNRYIQEETLFWLAGTGNPAVRYCTMKEFPDAFKGDALAAYSAMRSCGQVSRLADGNGIPGDTERYDLLYKGTVWAFAELVTMGLDMNDAACARAAGFILHSLQLPSGGFSMNWVPPEEAAGWTGDILYCLLRAGYDGPEVHRAAEWLTAHQRSDGGWLHSPLGTFADLMKMVFLRRAGSGSARECDPGRESCFLATVSCGRALALYFSRYAAGCGAVSRAAEFVLSKGRLNGTQFSGGEGYMSNFAFQKLGYPVLCQQDLLSTL
ncbi:MAG: hypothetical protein ACRCUT_05180, partial [Spirochaetota bacterium]